MPGLGSLSRVIYLEQASRVSMPHAARVQGPVRATATKPEPAEPLGLDGLARIVSLSPLPAVVIGGIGAADIPAIKAAGCRGLAVISAISAHSDPMAAITGSMHRVVKPPTHMVPVARCLPHWRHNWLAVVT